MTLKAKPAGGEPAGNERSGGRIELGYGDYTAAIPALSRIRLKTLCDLAGEMADYYLEKCHSLIDSPDSDFNQPFSMLIVCLDLQELYLQRLAGGENV